MNSISGFVLPQVLARQSHFKQSSFSTVCPRKIASSGSRRNLKSTSKCKKCLVFAQWQESLLPADPSVPPLEVIYKNFPSKYAQCFLLGTDVAKQLAFITAHNHRCARRPTSAPSSYALPIPLSYPRRKSYMLLRDALAYVYAIPKIEDIPFHPADSSSVTGLLPQTLSHHLGVNHVTANDVFSYIYNEFGAVQNRAAFLQAILDCCGARVVAAAIVESALPASQGQMAITGVLYIERCVGTAIGEKLFSNAVPVEVEPDFALSLATATESECFLETNVFDSGCVRIDEMKDVYASCGYKAIYLNHGSTADGVNLRRIEGNEYGERAWITSNPIWQWTASDVIALSDDELRQALRDQDIGVRQGESNDSLLGKVADLMDEVHRRELGIMLAAKAGMYGLAAELQRGRSKRGKLMVKLRELEEQGRWSEVAEVASEIKRLEAQTHDITLEPGSYNPDLDQDDWYRPCR